MLCFSFFFFFQAEDGIRDTSVTGVQTCALPISAGRGHVPSRSGDGQAPPRSRRGASMKTMFKSLANGLTLLLVLPCFLAYRMAALVLGPQKAFAGWSQAYGLVPGQLGVYLRRPFYLLTLPRCSTDACLNIGP